MKIIPLVPRGYCKGVIRAIQIAQKTVKEYPDQPVYILGPIVHNEFVSKALSNLGIITLDDTNSTRYDLLDKIDSGVVIFSAHGVSEYVYSKAKEKGLTVIDASCSDVVSIKDKVMNHLEKSYTVFYIGKKHHPETEGICFNHPEIYCIEDTSDIPLELNTTSIYVTTQTTMSTYQVQPLYDAIRNIYPFAFFETQICHATTSRQQAVLNMSDEIDGVIVVGDPKSNNTNKLKKLAQTKPNVKVVVMINDLSELDASLFDHCQFIAITSGASTPNSITTSIIEYMKAYANGEHPEKKPLTIDQILI